MIKHLLAVTALAISSATLAHADTINGTFQAFGNDSFTTNTITFAPNTSTVEPAITGTFQTYLTTGDAITFLSGPLPYNQGYNQVPTALYPTGYVPLFTVSNANAATMTPATETFTFNLTDYTAQYTSGTASCASAAGCLNITGDGFFTGAGLDNFTSSPASFIFTSQYAANASMATMTTFSASIGTTSAVPEPASLALVGSSILGFAGIARRKLASRLAA